MLDIGAIAGATEGLTKLIYEIIHDSQRELIDQKRAAAIHDADKMLSALCDDNWDYVQLLLDGLSIGISPSITPNQRHTLVADKLSLDKYALLGLYCRARAAMMLNEVLEVVRSTKPE